MSRRLLVLLNLCFAVTATSLSAQEPPAGAAAALEKVFERPAGQRINRIEVGRRFIAFFFKYEENALGRLGYATALRDFFDGDTKAAVKGLDGFFKKFDTIRVDEHRRMAGRIYLNAFVTEVTQKTPAVERLAHLAGQATRLYRPTATVARTIRTSLVRKKIANADPVYAAVRRAIEGGGESEADRKKATVALGANVKQIEKPRIFRDLVPFAAKSLDGETIDIGKLKGKVVLVDFWGTWCGPCIREMPNVVRAYEKYKAQGFVIIGVALDHPDKAGKIREIEQRFGMKWPQVYDGGFWNTKVAQLNRVSAVPCTYLLDRTGKTRYYRVNGQKLLDAIGALVKEDSR
ncbi:MAG: hypothetical protein CMJ83_10715 [Planctomycetes bacterium]|nr:hypothetical protein [Planctomycetota bacterium]